jgi:hypothetical protein
VRLRLAAGLAAALAVDAVDDAAAGNLRFGHSEPALFSSARLLSSTRSGPMRPLGVTSTVSFEAQGAAKRCQGRSKRSQ